jgi:hypothetical protein
MMIMQTDRFKGILTEMLGKDCAEAIRGLAQPNRRISEGSRGERLEWDEIIEDSETGRRYSIHPSARVEEGKVTAVGIRSDDFLFMIDINDQGAPFFVVVPKDGEFEPGEVNWVREEDGIPFNWEVE